MQFNNQFKVPASEIKTRSQNIQKELQQAGIDGLFIVQRVDLFYFSGTAQNGYMYIPAEGKPLLFIKQYLPRAREESSIADIIKIESIADLARRHIQEWIVTGEYHPGQQIKEEEISQRMGISRPPVREALKRLSRKLHHSCAPSFEDLLRSG